MSVEVVGVDGCKSGWVGASYDPDAGRLAFSTHADFSSLLVACQGAASIAVDIPIGLTDSFRARNCDQRARKLIGPRSSSISPAPDRRLLQFSTYSEASAFSRERCSKGLTRQCFAIFRKIAQAESMFLGCCGSLSQPPETYGGRIRRTANDLATGADRRQYSNAA